MSAQTATVLVRTMHPTKTYEGTLEDFAEYLNTSVELTADDVAFRMSGSLAKRPSKVNLIVADLLVERADREAAETARRRESVISSWRNALKSELIEPMKSADILQIGRPVQFGGAPAFKVEFDLSPNDVSDFDAVYEQALEMGLSIKVGVLEDDVTEGHWDGYGGYCSTSADISIAWSVLSPSECASAMPDEEWIEESLNNWSSFLQ